MYFYKVVYFINDDKTSPEIRIFQSDKIVSCNDKEELESIKYDIECDIGKKITLENFELVEEKQFLKSLKELESIFKNEEE